MANIKTNCPSEMVLITIAMNGAHELNGIDLEQVADHIRSCPECWKRTRALADPPRGYRGLDLAA